VADTGAHHTVVVAVAVADTVATMAPPEEAATEVDTGAAVEEAEAEDHTAHTKCVVFAQTLVTSDLQSV
jgi:hypothetical protein